MRIHCFRAREFRNLAFVELPLEKEGRHYLHGPNGQGKTNLLEGLGLVSTLRSFRTRETRALLRREARPREAQLYYALQTKTEGDSEIELRLRPEGKQVTMDGEPLRRMADLLGRFPTLTLSSHDIELLRGSPGQRRRFLDMLLAGLDGAYFGFLTRYHKALQSRNALLKKGAPASLRRPFEESLGEAGAGLVALRQKLLATYRPHFKATYARISRVEEEPELHYRANLEATETGRFAEAMAAQEPRDCQYGTTTRGPHRDDLELRLEGHPAREYASEGQQRGLVLALRLAFLSWCREEGREEPVVLADDIVGELDEKRRGGFWELLRPCPQIIATGTAVPREFGGEEWKVWRVHGGNVVPEERGVPS